MTAYMGPLGSLAPIGQVTSLSVSTARSATYRETLGGRVTSRRGARPKRSWSVGMDDTTTSLEAANLAAFVAGEFGPGPWAFADEWAQVTNLLTARDAALATPWQNTVIGGSSALDGGSVYAGRTLVAIDGNASSNSLSVDDARGVIAPVRPGMRVTLSAWLDTKDAFIGARFITAGGTLGATVEAQRLADGWARVSRTVTVPGEAAYVRLYMRGAGRMAKPAFTWTDRLMPYHSGQGASSVVVSDIEQGVAAAWLDDGGQRASASVTVVEVG